MKAKVKKVSIAVFLFAFLGAGAFGAYVYKDTILEKISPGYSSKYTPEEMSERLFSLQKKLGEKLREEYQKDLSANMKQRVTGDLDFSVDINSVDGGGSGTLNLKGIDIQYDDRNLDMIVNEISLGGDTNPSLNGTGLSGILEGFHMIVNGSGSYMKVENNDFEGVIAYKEMLMTLNQLGKEGKYINLSNNYSYNFALESIQDQTESADVESLLQYIENEKLFEVYKQEDTKYHLVPSKFLCKGNKRKKINNNEDSVEYALNANTFENTIIDYEDFQNNYADCSQEEYSEYVDNFLNHDIHKVKNFYVESGKTKLHFVFDLQSHQKGPNDPGEATKINIGTDIVFSINSMQQSKSYLQIDDTAVSGSGIIIETSNDTFNTTIDFQVPEYKFDTNMSFSGTTDVYNMIGNYSAEFPDNIKDYYFREFEGNSIYGDMTLNSHEGVSSFVMNNTLDNQQQGVSTQLNIKSNSILKDDTNTGDLIVDIKYDYGEKKDPISGNINFDWDTKLNETQQSGEMNLNFDVPHAMSGKSQLRYNLESSDIIESAFTSPKNVILERELENLLEKNKAVVERAEKIKLRKKIINLRAGKNNFGIYEIQAMNSKVTSDLRILASALETTRTRKSTTLKEFLNNPKIVKRTAMYTIYSGALNFDILGQNEKDFTSPYTGKGYEIRIMLPNENKKTELGDSYYQLYAYQIGGERYLDNEFELHKIGNYFQAQKEWPESLFDLTK